jgi:hypothetical protein
MSIEHELRLKVGHLEINKRLKILKYQTNKLN